MATATEPVQTDKTPATATTEDLIRDVKSGAKTMDDLPREDRLKVMEKLSAEPNEVPAAEPAPVEKPVETLEKKPETPVEPSVAELSERAEKARAEQKRMADEANRLEQKAKAARERREKAQKDLEAAEKAEVKLPEELLSEGNQSDVLKRLKAIEERNKVLEKIVLEKDADEEKSLTDRHRTVTESLQFSEVDEVQNEFPSLKMSEPFNEANGKYGAWINEIQAASGLKEKDPNIDPAVLRTKAKEMWDKDPEFQKKITNQPPKDLDKLMVLLTAYNNKQATGGTVLGHTLEHFKRTGVLHNMLQRVAQSSAADAATRTAKALTNDEITPVGPGDGSTKGYAADGGWTKQKALQVIDAVTKKQASAGRASPEERALQREAMDYLASAETT